MIFDRRLAYGTPRYYPKDKEARELVAIFRHPPAKTLSQQQFTVLSRFGIKFKLLADEMSKLCLENAEVDGV
jgi:hypothetical protein